MNLTFEQHIRRLASRGHAKIPEDVMIGILKSHEDIITSTRREALKECSFDHKKLIRMSKLEGAEEFISILNEKWEGKTVGPQFDRFFDDLFNESVDETLKTIKGKS